MGIDAENILSILDSCCEHYTFPMLDNGYVYLAATRLSLYSSPTDWAMVIEVFGFSPRAGVPDTHIYTFASKLYNRDNPEQYANREDYERYLTNNPHNDSRFIYLINEGYWQDIECDELVAEDATEIVVRGQAIPLPSIDDYADHSIEVEDPSTVQVFELCRFLAAVARDQVLATPEERRISVLPDMIELLRLEEWHHPDLVHDERPSGSETFQQLAQVLATGNISLYAPSKPPNTHWRYWPESGSL